MEISAGTVINDRYQILEMVGRGSTAEVYSVWDQRLSKQWAMKCFLSHNGQVKQPSTAEAQILLSLDHPLLPKIIDIDRWQERAILVRDLVPGDDLENFVDEHGPFSIETLENPIRSLAKVLDYLHDRPSPIVYRDLKPANVIVRPDGALALVDFGITRVYHPLYLADTEPLGTKGYCAPEQYGYKQSCPSTDVYALGALIYFMLTGNHLACVSEGLLWEDFQTAPLMRLKQVISKCMAHDIDNRYASAMSVVDAIYLNQDRVCSEPEAYEIDKHVDINTKQTIGLMGIKRGVGVTHIVNLLARSTARLGLRVAVINQNNHNALKILRGYKEGYLYCELGDQTEAEQKKYKEGGITYYPKLGPEEQLKVINDTYDLIIIDYGTEHRKIADFLRCHHKWLVCPSNPIAYSGATIQLETLSFYGDLKFIFNLATKTQLGEICSWLQIKKHKASCFGYTNELLSPEEINSYFGIGFEYKKKSKSIFQKRGGWI